MNIKITPKQLSGSICAIPSKSQAHRLLICAAFSDRKTILNCQQTNEDIEATADCLRALGADILRTETGYIVSPIKNIPQTAELNCRESGSTLRFMLPIVGALGVDATFQLAGRLPQRPLSPLWELMEQKGCELSRPTNATIRCRRKLTAGHYSIDGGVSSQFITGLLFALSLIDGQSTLEITGKLESKPYITMTQQALNLFGVKTGNKISCQYPFTSPGLVDVEGDWSNGAFFVVAKHLGSNLEITGLCQNSAQGDRAVAQLVNTMQKYCTISAADIPDLVPILSVYAAANCGAVFTDIERLRLKESDRVASVAKMLCAFGIETEVTQSTLTIHAGKFHGCEVCSENDHRIAMSAAIAATMADGPVIIKDAQCVSKSYPDFWSEYKRLGGCYEQYIRK